MSPRRAWPWLLAAVVVVSGCSSTTSGEPAPLTAPPAVPHPLDLSRHVDHACALLDAQDFADAGIVMSPGSGYPNDSTFDDKPLSTCYGPNDAETVSLTLYLHPEKNLLTLEYRKLDHTEYSFRGAFIDGYPAIFERPPSVDGHRDFGCQVMIATAARQSIQLRYSNVETTDETTDETAACGLVTALARRVLGRLGA